MIEFIISALAVTASGIKFVKEVPFTQIGRRFRAKHRVIVLGSSGTGKSQWLISLDKTLRQAAISPMTRTAAGVSVLREVGTTLFELRDTPGHHESLRRQEINIAFKKKVSGIINVVSYGYHEGYVGASVAVSDDATAQEGFLAESLQRELSQLDEWTGLLGGNEEKRFLLTIVNKADLWWDHRAEVIEYYTNGAYAKALGDARDLGHIVCLDRALRKPFFDQVPGSGLFSEAERGELRDMVIEAMGAAIGKTK